MIKIAKPPSAYPVHRLLALLAIFVLVPQIAVGAYFAYLNAKDARKNVESAAVALATTLSQNIDREIAGISGTLRGLAASSELEREDWGAFQLRASAVLPSLASAGVAVRNRDGKLLFNSNAPLGAPLPPSNPELRAFDAKIFETDAAVVSNLHIGGVSRRPLIIVGVPARGGNGEIYSLSAGIDPRRFAQTVSDVALPQGWLASVIGQDRRIIARSRDLDRFLGSPASLSLTQQAAGDQGFVFTTTLDGVESVTAYKTSSLNGWTVITSAPRTIWDEPVRSVWRSHLLLVVLALLSSLAAALGFGRMIGGGMADLAKEAQALGRSERIGRKATRVAEIEKVHDSLVAAAIELDRRAVHQTMLMAELDHRVKNTLAIIQSLASRTMNTAATPAEGVERLHGRVMALARSHEALSSAGWEEVPLSAVARAICSEIDVPVSISGPDVSLRSRAVVAVAQSLHELAADVRRTELSVGRMTRVDLTWTREGDSVWLVWSDTVASRDFASLGFGRDIIRLCIERQLGGEVHFAANDDSRTFRAHIPARCENLGQNLYV